jgi:hypothetical protein
VALEFGGAVPRRVLREDTLSRPVREPPAIRFRHAQRAEDRVRSGRDQDLAAGNEQRVEPLPNTSSAGSIIAFHKYHEDLAIGDYGTICSFGAGYSIGNVVVRRVG